MKFRTTVCIIVVPVGTAVAIMGTESMLGTGFFQTIKTLKKKNPTPHT